MESVEGQRYPMEDRRTDKGVNVVRLQIPMGLTETVLHGKERIKTSGSRPVCFDKSPILDVLVLSTETLLVLGHVTTDNGLGPGPSRGIGDLQNPLIERPFKSRKISGQIVDRTPECTYCAPLFGLCRPPFELSDIIKETKL